MCKILIYIATITVYIYMAIVANVLILGLSTGRFRLGLCPTRNRLDQIGWTESQPTADREDDRIGPIETSTGSGQVERG